MLENISFFMMLRNISHQLQKLIKYKKIFDKTQSWTTSENIKTEKKLEGISNTKGSYESSQLMKIKKTYWALNVVFNEKRYEEAKGEKGNEITLEKDLKNV